MEMGSLPIEEVYKIVAQAEEKAAEAEVAAAEERRRQKEQERIDAATREIEAQEQAQREAAGIAEMPSDLPTVAAGETDAVQSDLTTDPIPEVEQVADQNGNGDVPTGQASAEAAPADEHAGG